jgi:hypothetical protein
MQVMISTSASGTLRVVVLDRDGFVVRDLGPRTVRKGSITLTWDGRDASGRVVPDEAYSLRADLRAGKDRWTYFPARDVHEVMQEVPVRAFDPRSGILSYTLTRPSRVHAQAGTAVIDNGGHATGPVLKTIVERAPRVAGAVVEQWDGRDESGTIDVANLPHFAVSIAATPLPENAMITIGNRATTFLATAQNRVGHSLLSPQAMSAHHGGLDALHDVAPHLEFVVPTATRVIGDKSWRQDRADLQIRAVLEGINAKEFAATSDALLVFLDGKEIAREHPRNPTTLISLRLPAELAPGSHILALNWVNGHGPVAVKAAHLSVSPPRVAVR